VAKFKFEQSFGRQLGVVHTALFKHLSKLMKHEKLPITPDQFRVLTHLWQQDGRSQQELASLSCRDRANVTRVIDILEREGIVARKDAPNDRRAFQIFLTAKGKKIEEGAATCAQQSIKDALKGFTKDETTLFMTMLHRVNQNLK
jgi:DNA-binding MarR family transcriptional regulator